jgi:hypothetical protein
MPPFIVRPKERSGDPNDYFGWNSTPWHLELTVLNLVADPLKTKTISIKGHEYQSAQSSSQPHDLTYQSFCKTHVSHGNNTLSSIAETNSRGLDAFNLPLFGDWWQYLDSEDLRVEVFEHVWFTSAKSNKHKGLGIAYVFQANRVYSQDKT